MLLFSRSLSSKLQALELFTAITVIDSGNISVNLSKDKEFVLQEPVPLAVVVTYGIGGDCIVEELLCNISTDEIYSYGKGVSEMTCVFNFVMYIIHVCTLYSL